MGIGASMMGDGSDSKESACNAGDRGSIPGLGISPGEGNGNPPQCSCLEKTMDRELAWKPSKHIHTGHWKCRGITCGQSRLSPSQRHRPQKDKLSPSVFSIVPSSMCFLHSSVSSAKDLQVSLIELLAGFLKSIQMNSKCSHILLGKVSSKCETFFS